MNSRIRHLANVTRQELSSFIQNSHCFDTDWGCSCLVCSWLLEKVLKAHGLDCKLCVGDWNDMDHAFVMVGDSVIDITATQFKLPEIHLEQLKGSSYTVNVSGRQAHLDIKNWPEEQSPRSYKRKLANIFRQVMQRTS